MTKQAIGLWCKKPGAPVRIDGARMYLRWPDFARWREDELKRGGGEKDDTTGTAHQRRALADARNAEIALARNELALARELGDSVSVTDYGKAMGVVLDRLCSRVRALSSRLSRFGPEVETAAAAEGERLIAELNEWSDNVLDESDDEPDEQAEAA